VPNFDEDGRYKAFATTKDNILNLMYAQKFYKSIKQLGKDYCIIFLPFGENINYVALNDFFDINIRKMKYTTEIEDNLTNENVNDDNDILYSDITDDISENFNDIRFDIILQKKGSHVNENMLYIPRILKSKLREQKKQHDKIKKEVETIYNIDRYKINFWNSLICFFDEKTYSKFLIKCIYEIYSDKYNNNLLLNSQFIKKVEKSIRDNKFMYIYYKMNYDFLKMLENKNINMKENKNFKLGYLIGIMSHSKRSDTYQYRENLYTFVNDFAGQLSKKISELKDIIKYVNTLQQKIELNKYYFNNEIFKEYLEFIKNFDEKFDKELFIIGFFDGYYKQEKIIEK
jgi:hypothetical protein